MADRIGAKVLRPSRTDERDNGLHLSNIRQLVESVFWTLKDDSGSSATGRAPSPESAPE